MSASASSPFRRGPLPLVIGAVGHPDLRQRDTGKLEELVSGLLDSLLEKHPYTPLLIISSLGEGAEQLVARVGLRKGARLFVPLPMQQTYYETTFDSEESRHQFRELLRQAERRYTLPLLEGNTPDNVREPGPHRDKQYAFLGAFIVQHCQMLVALWDGVDRKLVGGTAHIVQFQLSGLPEPYNPPQAPLDSPEGGPVFHILTPRASKPGPADQAPSASMTWPQPESPAANPELDFEAACRQLDAFNQAVVRQGTDLAEQGRKAAAALLPAEQAQALPESARSLWEMYGLAEALSRQRQAASHDTAGRVIALGLAALAWLLVYMFWLPYLPVASVPVALLGYGWYLQRGLRSPADHSFTAQCAALAEGLRVQLAWRLAGLDDQVAPLYLRRHSGAVRWIRGALRGLLLPVPGERAPTRDFKPEHYRLLVDGWLTERARWYAEAPKKDVTGLDRSISRVRLFGLLSLILAALVVVAGLLPASAATLLRPLMTMASVLSLAACGAHAIYALLLHTSASRQQEAAFGQLYALAARRLSEFLGRDEVSGARRLVRDVGRWALAHAEDTLPFGRA